MNLLKLFQTRSGSFYVLLILLGLVSSLTNIGILMLINTALGGKSIVLFGEYNYLAFIVLILVSFISTSFFQNYMVELTNGIMFNLELSIVQKVRNASYESFGKVGPDRIYAAISDARVLSRVPEIFVTLVNSSVTIICSLLYLFWVSALGGITVLSMMVVLLLIYLYRNKKIEKDLNKVRDLQDSYYTYLAELLAGFKQIRISPLRNNNLFNKYILTNRSTSKSLSVRASRRYVVNELTGVYSWYIVLGVIIFLLPVLFNISIIQLAAFITTVLFMMSPVSQLITFFPFYTAFKIAVDRISQIDQQLETGALPSQEMLSIPEGFQSIRFEQVVYKYNGDETASFELDLADFHLPNEEILFITGGNGSGKTTFVNVLTGLCKPVSGKIFINEREVTWEEFAAFSQRMAVVYTNHHLFIDNYDEHDLSEKNDQLHELQKLLNLDGILKIDREKERIDAKLSKGQQKRLALLLALLENKPILILDEWAAEQDPQNRRLFYTKWLQEMKKRGKTIIAVSHDDDFYHVADRVMKFNFGHISHISTPVQETV